MSDKELPMTTDLNADLVEMLRAGWPDADERTVEMMLRNASGTLSAILAWANARRDAAVAEKDAEIARLRSALAAIDDLPVMEINPSNYGYDDVCELNANAVEAVSIARAALEPQPPELSR